MPSADSHPRLLSARKIWDAAPYNAFTGLARFNDRFYCGFREGTSHISFDGTLRILASHDGISWDSAATLAWPGADVRDAKLSVSPAGELLLHAAVRSENPPWLRSTLWRSKDGRHWDAGTHIVDPGVWLWGITWHNGVGYGMGYAESLGPCIRLYTTSDGTSYTTRADLPVPGQPSEHALAFLDDNSAVCLLRRDGKLRSALLGISSPPYTTWKWNDLGHYVGGPAILRIPDGRIIAVNRHLDDRQFQRIALCWIDPKSQTMTEFLTLPGAQDSGPPHPMGDWGYAGLAWHNHTLWISYYSPHQEKTAIHIAQVAL